MFSTAEDMSELDRSLLLLRKGYVIQKTAVSVNQSVNNLSRMPLSLKIKGKNNVSNMFSTQGFTFVVYRSLAICHNFATKKTQMKNYYHL